VTVAVLRRVSASSAGWQTRQETITYQAQAANGANIESGSAGSRIHDLGAAVFRHYGLAPKGHRAGHGTRAPLIGRLADLRRVPAFDRPGHGLSGPLRLHRGQAVRGHAAAVLRGLYEALDIQQGRWKLLILHHLLIQAPRRFSDLERAIPAVTQKMLIQQLRALESDGVVARTAYPEVPPRVEYTLTAAGAALEPALNALHDWAASDHLAS
jgi:DNA-binding HxlR family transcriptional regulator